MILIGELLLACVLTYVIVCIVSLITKKWIAFIIVLLCLFIYGGVIMLFSSGVDQHEVGYHDHYKCK